MGIDALTHRNDGTKVTIPVTQDDWQQWVSAGRTRHWMLNDPLLDWLQLYGKSRGYVPKKELSGYDKDLDLVEFLFAKGKEFEAGMLQLLQRQFDVVAVAQNHKEINKIEKAEETFALMKEGVPIIYQAVLWDVENMTYGSPDFLIRSDILHQLFPESIAVEETAISAPDLTGKDWHYRVVDAKFTTLHLNASGTQLTNGGSAVAYKAQLYVYNRMLGRLQGFEPPESYLLGRSWQRTQKGVTHRGSSAMERLGPVSQDGTITNQVPIAGAVEEALRWVRRVRTEGQNWQLLPKPSVPELYPNMGHADNNMMLGMGPAEMDTSDEEDGSADRWEDIKKWLAGELKELTQLWQVGVQKRRHAHSDGIYRWDDPRLTPATIGITGEKQERVIQRLLTVNRDDNLPVLPLRVEAARAEWHESPGVEFYVDFEYCSDLNDDFSRLPEKGGQPIIFMIGCGHVENGDWRFKSLVANDLSETEESRIIRDWLAHMESVRDRLDPGNAEPQVIHWSAAEPTTLQKAYNSAWNRHKQPTDWPDLAWYDFLQKVMREEPVVVRGALGFGLKAVANAMHSHGLIETDWADSHVDGLGAMVGAWHCDEEARRQDMSMTDLPLMKEIARYNEVDCKVMMEIVRYLRANH